MWEGQINCAPDSNVHRTNRFLPKVAFFKGLIGNQNKTGPPWKGRDNLNLKLFPRGYISGVLAMAWGRMLKHTRTATPGRALSGPGFFQIDVNAANQLDRMQNHRVDKQWVMTIVREFLPWAEVRGPSLNVGGTKPQVGDLGWIQRSKWVVLPGYRGSVATHLTLLLLCCPCHDGLCPQTVSRNSPAFLNLLLDRNCATLVRKVTNIL